MAICISDFGEELAGEKLVNVIEVNLKLYLVWYRRQHSDCLMEYPMPIHQ